MGPSGLKKQRKALFLTGPHCVERTNRMKPKPQARSEVLSFFSVRQIRTGRKGEKCVKIDL